MDITIRTLTQELADDYFDFFDNVAFADHKDWQFCYCTYFHFVDEDVEQLIAENGDSNKPMAVRMITEGTMHGYLAYADGNVVGFCNAGAKSSYKRICHAAEMWTDDTETGCDIMATVCFIIAAAYRGQGIATKLLAYACKDAKARGYKVIQGYPGKGELDCFNHFHGPASLYERAGFSVVAEHEQYNVVQKTL